MEFGDKSLSDTVWRPLRLDESGCWIWTKEAKAHRLGFKVTVGGRQRPAHHVLFEAMVGYSIVLGMGHRLIRKCGRDLCCNPHHMEIGKRFQPPQKPDISGQRFGYLVVVERSPGKIRNDGAHRKAWWCKCDCGALKEIREENLLTGETRSCGCMRYELLVKHLEIGQVNGHCVVVGRSELKNRYGSCWVVRCDCGNERIWTRTQFLKSRSCGCLQGRECEARPSANGRRSYKKRGQSKDPRYGIWSNMIGRCSNPRNSHFMHYGGRGVVVCDRWLGEDGFFNFIADVGERPSKKHSIDRVDVNGDYEPNNVRWATQIEQMQNTRTSRARVARVLEDLEGRDPDLIAELRKQLLGAG